MAIIFLDTESYSDVDIKLGSAKRTSDRSTDLLSVAYKANDSGVKLWQWGNDFSPVKTLVEDKNTTIIAHNAEHDIGELRSLGGCKIPYTRVIDTAALAAIYNAPRSLEGACKHYGIKGKLDNNAAMVFWKPNRKGERVFPFDNPKAWKEALAYNQQDVMALEGLYKALIKEDYFIDEWQVWEATALMNERGVAFDWPAVEGALDIIEEEKIKAHYECRKAIGFNPTQRDRVLEWINKDLSVEDALPDLQKETIRQALLEDLLAPPKKRILELRQMTSHSGPLGKLSNAVAMRCPDGRVHGQMIYAGTLTGRWVSRGLQLQNIPRPSLKTASMERLWGMLSQGASAIPALKKLFSEDLLKIISSNLRGAIVPSAGLNLGVCDYSKIECCVICWLSGMQDIADALATGKRDIYRETAALIYGVRETDVTDNQRFLGKMVVLGAGYGLGGKGLKEQLQNAGVYINEELADKAIAEYRKAFRPVTKLWKVLWQGAVDCIEKGVTVPISKGARFEPSEGVLKLFLPSGRAIFYPGAKVEEFRGLSRVVTYKTPIGVRKILSHTVLSENLASGIARDLIAFSLLTAKSSGLKTLFTVHDEIVIEGGAGVAEALKECMLDLPDWAAEQGLIVGAEAKELKRYGK